MNYKVGDKVRVISEDHKNIDQLTPSMKHLCGQIVTIEIVSEYKDYYTLAEDPMKFHWDDSMFEGNFIAKDYEEFVIKKYDSTISVKSTLGGKDQYFSLYNCSNKNMSTKEMLEDIINKIYFEPYIKDSLGNKYILGKKTDFTLAFNEPLYVGDIVEVYNTSDKKISGTYFVLEDEIFRCRKFDCSPSKFSDCKYGICSSYQFRKIKSYKELENKECFCGGDFQVFK